MKINIFALFSALFAGFVAGIFVCRIAQGNLKYQIKSPQTIDKNRVVWYI